MQRGSQVDRRLGRVARLVHAGPKMSVMAAPSAGGDARAGVSLTDLDDPLFEGANASKRDLVDYLDGVDERLLPPPHDRALSVIRVHRGQEAFMQRNLPKYAPEWLDTREQSLGDENPVVDERLELIHDGRPPIHLNRWSVAPPAVPGDHPDSEQTIRICVSLSSRIPRGCEQRRTLLGS
jgi:hypothetical protein